MKKENKKQIVVSQMMGKSVENKALSSAGCPIRSGMTGGHFTQHTQSGRSMVEMLGVLAIMGVLSVGGVSMYSSAMNKHRANEILNEASKRAVMVAGQLLSNPEAATMSLAQFGDNTVAGATFGENATISDNNITLTLSDVDEDICAQMQAALGDSTIMAVDDDCSQITFNADMSRGVDDNGGNDANLGEACDADNPCVDGCQECVNGHCQDKCAEGEVCAMGADDNDYACKAQPAGCSTCTSEQYCDVSSSISNCSNLDTGTCVDKESNSDFEAQKKTIIFSDGSTLDVYQGDSMTWWTAKNWCNAHGKQMVSLDDLKCTDMGCSDKTALQNVLGENYFWTKNTTSSCSALPVSTTKRNHTGSAPHYSKMIALCK
ncbi:MAG: type II secretion system protein [Alphaproteobacteria bacterium]